MDSPKTQVIVVDDQMIARGYFEDRVRGATRYELAGSFGSAEAALDFCASHHVDLALVDVVLRQGLDGLTLAERLRALTDPPRVIVVTSMPEATYLARAQAAGVESFWYKEYATAPLLEVMDATMTGERVYPGAAPPVALGHALGGDLTTAELAVLREMVTGATNAEIARRLYLSVHTVNTHVKRLLAKTVLATRTQLAVEAISSGLVVLDGHADAGRPAAAAP